ncbi:speckle-type POZ protein B-like [Planococcus citri]|uniref:speckle-type POZ protein B-like n=1 Tax=Planococcus citri TaxID=170843 RepID=UPI0031F81A3A
MMSNISPASKNEGITDSCCDTTVKQRECSFLWTIDSYSTLTNTRFDFESSEFSAIDDNFKWRLEHKTQTWGIEIYLRPDLDDLKKYGGVSVSAEFAVMKPDNTKIYTKISSSSCCVWNDNYIKYKNVGSLGDISKVLREWVYEDKLKLLCELVYFKKTDIVNLSSSCCSKPVKISESSLSTDYERFFIDDDNFKDVTISVKGKNYPVHKTVLAARSSVFNAMLRNDMQESQKNHINIADIEQETFEEILHYIYTGKTTNLEESAFELLPAADKYDLKELKTKCEEVLFRKLSIDNAGSILILADMHHAEDLKAHALRFIKANHSECEDFKETEVWNIVTKSHPHLMEDLLDVIFCKRRKLS